MTEQNLPATTGPGSELAHREPPPIASADVDGWANVIGSIAKLAEHIAGTPFVPKDLRGSAAAVTAAILYGREVGLPPMAALTQTHVIEGKPAASAEAMRALVLAQGHEIEVEEASGTIVTMRARRRGSDSWTRISWTIDQAKHAGIAGKDNWRKYPRAMLTARCSAELVRLVFPDVIHGLRALEEYDVDPLARAEEAPAPVEGAKVRRRRALPSPAVSGPTDSRPHPDPVQSDAPGSPVAAGGAAEGVLPLPGEDGYDDGTPAAAAGSGDPAAAVHEAEAQGRPLTVEETEAVEEIAKCPVRSPGRGRACRREANHDGRHYYGRDSGSQAPEEGPEEPIEEVIARDMDERQAGADAAAPECSHCPPGCPSCSPPDCECYTHQDEPDRRHGEPEPVVDETPPPAAASGAQVRMMQARMSELGIPAEDADEQRTVLGALVGRTLTSRRQITKQDAQRILDTLARVNSHRELLELVDAVEREREAGA